MKLEFIGEYHYRIYVTTEGDEVMFGEFRKRSKTIN
jgi:hypothetical protein